LLIVLTKEHAGAFPLLETAREDYVKAAELKKPSWQERCSGWVTVDA
jgi:hypothetical protein